MLLNKTTLTNLFTGLKAAFNGALSSFSSSDWEKTATKVPSTTKQEDYSWFEDWPKMKRWVGDKVVKALSGHKYSIINEDFEVTVAVKRNDIEDDSTGQYNLKAQAGGQSAAELPDEVITELKDNAFTDTCYDGQYFYDTDHVAIGKDGEEVTISNKGTAALKWDTLANAQASIGAALNYFGGLYDNNGRKLKVRPTILEVPTSLATTATMLMTNDKLGDGSPNPFKGRLTVVENPLLDSSTQWMVHSTGGVIKPFIYQERKAPMFVSQTNMEADDVFSRAEYKFGAEARVAGGYTFWQLSYGSTGQ